MPRHLQVEGGFDDGNTVSSLGDSNTTSATNKRQVEIEEELDEQKKSRLRLNDTMDELTSFLKAAKKEDEAVDKRIKLVGDYSQMMTDSQVLDSLSPLSRSKYVNAIKKRRKRVIDELEKEDSN